MIHLLALVAMQTYSRSVTFSYVPGNKLKSVVVVGQFNNWDRAANPLSLLPDGRTWNARFDIPVGVYQYLFCEDGQRWVRDPSAPAVPDANGNLNSKLVVAPLDYDMRPGENGDGIVTLSAVRHVPDRTDTARVDRRTAWVRLRTRAGDVARVFVKVNGKAYPMERTSGDDLYDLWQGRFRIGRGREDYRFLLDDSPKPGRANEGRGVEFGPYSQDLSAYPLPKPPIWVQDAVFYQIFPERFANGDSSNDGPEVKAWDTIPTPQTWRMRVGGDLSGIRQHLDHLRDLGANAIYLNPIFESLSNHAYDTVDYLNVDPRFGTNDDLVGLVKDAHRAGMRMMLDGVFNHSSPMFYAFKDLLEKQQASAYMDWFYVLGWPVSVGEGQKTYRTFAGVPTMPKLNQDNPATRDYFLRIGSHWIKEAGIDGWRLDVADEVSHEFWKRFQKEVRGAKKDAYILGEAWGDAHEYLQGDEHDAVMNYRWRKAVLDFLAYRTSTPSQLDNALRRIRDDYPQASLLSQLNLLGSHDTERIRTVMKGDLRRERLALVLQFTYPGVPSIYYGDEVGMEGGKDPDQRRPMIWDRSRWDTSLLTFYRYLIEKRRTHLALRRGAYKTLIADDKTGVFGFRRSYRGKDVDVYVNSSTRSVAVGGMTIEPLGYSINASP